jgi:hypothetical protein
MLKYFFYWPKNLSAFIIFLAIFLLQLNATGQKMIALQDDSVFKKHSDKAVQGYDVGNLYYVSQWKSNIPHTITVIRKIDEQHAIVEITNKKVFDSLSAYIKVAAANDTWKLSPAAERLWPGDDDKIQKIIVTAHNNDVLLALLKNQGIPILRVDAPSHSLIIECKPTSIRRFLLPSNDVIFIDVWSEPHPEIGIIGYDRSFHGINAVDYEIPGANGLDIVAGVKEQKMDESDIDLYKRVLSSPIAAATTSYHATVIASIIGGAGNSFYDGRGIANHCLFFPSSFENLFADDAAVLTTNNVTVQNHSYGTEVQQFYGAEAVSYDAITWSNKSFIPVFSAGNHGLASASEGIYANMPGFANLTGNFKMAKNVITVGAIDNKGNVAAESSAGPLYDGRLGPQLIALGPNGTSDATAIVSGTIAVMQQVYKDSSNNSLPPASLVKAILYNTTDDIYNRGIDYKTGYGLLNSYAAVKAIQQKKFDGGEVAQSDDWIKTISVPANTAQLKITLAWTDTAASVNNNKAIINDLDLEVKKISDGAVYMPWVLDASPNADSLIQLPVRKRDSLNTAEQVSIQLPSAGEYEIKVSGNAINTSSIAFNIAYNTDTLNTFRFTSPLHASDVNRDENQLLAIRWRTYVTDTNETGNLFISYNNGSTWEPIKTSQKLYINQYNWLIKDTASAAILKMETSYGVFFSSPFIISKVTRIVVDFFCTDSFRLSWNKHVYADSYKIFTLTDSPYLKLILTVNDTFAVFQKSTYPSLVYAVEPLLVNGLPAARSIAQNIALQGVNCFYKTFYYNVQDQNKLDLVLELSIASYVDSIFYEKVTASGQTQEVYGVVKVVNNDRIYHQLVNTPPPGTTYMRARIKLKSGATVYTDIINVITSGNKYLLFYPNPVGRNGQLSYALQQGVPTGSHLSLFDVNGRLLKKYAFIPDKIDVAGFAPGMYIYQLFSIDNTVLETGKLVIQ